MLRDILRGDEDAETAAGVIAHIDPDVILLTGVDYDTDGHALNALADLVERAGASFAHRFAWRPNTGRPSGLDLDGDGRVGGPRDALGYGRFNGADGMAVLSRYPVDETASRNYSDFLWRDFPDAIPPETYGPDVMAVLPLSTTGHWDLAIDGPDGRFHLWAFHASPPVFDGPEDRNGRRNHDEAAFWLQYLNAWEGPPLVLAGDANADPLDGDGRREAITALLSHEKLQDPEPRSAGGQEAAAQGGANARHRGDPSLDTADWSDGETGPGNLRVDYVLPSTEWAVVDSGVFWPGTDDPVRALLGSERGDAVSRHRLVWVDIRLKN